jgi:hypothetical protein
MQDTPVALNWWRREKGDPAQLPPVHGHMIWTSYSMYMVFVVLWFRHSVRSHDEHQKAVLRCLEKAKLSDADVQLVVDYIDMYCTICDDESNLPPEQQGWIMTVYGKHVAQDVHYEKSLEMLKQPGVGVQGTVMTLAAKDECGKRQIPLQDFQPIVNEHMVEQLDRRMVHLPRWLFVAEGYWLQCTRRTADFANSAQQLPENVYVVVANTPQRTDNLLIVHVWPDSLQRSVNQQPQIAPPTTLPPDWRSWPQMTVVQTPLTIDTESTEDANSIWEVRRAQYPLRNVGCVQGAHFI